MAKISPYGKYRAFDADGAPLSGGKLYTYEAGTTTPKPTYSDASGNTANANPVILDADGYADVWLDVGGYKFVLTDSNDVQQWTTDNIDGGGAAGFASQVITTSTGITLTSAYQNAVIVCTQPVTLSLVSASIAGDGYVAVIINRSSGNVTIAPDGAETINGASSFIVYPGGSCNIHTNGTTWYVSSDGQKEVKDDVFRILGSADITKKLAIEVDGITAANTRTWTAQDTSGTVYITGGQDVSVADGGTGASTAAAARTNLGLTMLGILNGLTLSNNVSNPNTRIDIAAGVAGSTTNGVLMTLASSLTKRLDATWTAGTNNGGLDTGSVANSTWYHVYLIKDVTNNLVDALFSTSATTPTMPTNYTEQRRVGAILTDGSSNILAFTQNGDEFWWSAAVSNFGTFAPNTTANLLTVTVPTGLSVSACLRGSSTNSGGAAVYRLITYPSVNDVAPTSANTNAGGGTNTVDLVSSYSIRVRTNTSGQIRHRSSSSNAGAIFVIQTEGWVDTRGRV